MEVGRRATKLLAAIAFALAAVVPSAPTTSALSCVREWGHDTFAGARQAVAHSAQAEGLVVGTIAAVERKADDSQTRVLVLAPNVVFSGDLRDIVRVQIGGHGPEMDFVQGGTYFLALSRGYAGTTRWIVDPCAPNMEITSHDQLTQLRAISDRETVLSEPAISSMPNALVLAAAAGLVGVGGMWLVRRRPPLPIPR